MAWGMVIIIVRWFDAKSNFKDFELDSSKSFDMNRQQQPYQG